MSSEAEHISEKMDFLEEGATSSFSSIRLSDNAYDCTFLQKNPAVAPKALCKFKTFQRNGNTFSSDLKNLFSRFDIQSKVIPCDIIVRARELCSKFLGGAWKSIPLEHFRLSAITGGMSNLLFLVELPESLKPLATEPSSALLRIHCSVDCDQLLNESVVFTLLSERALGPRLLGVFPGGRFEQYIPSRPLQCHELSMPSIVHRVGKMFARVHALDVPIAKESMIIEVTEGWLQKIYEVDQKMRYKMRLNMVDVDLNLCPQEITFAVLKEELDLLRCCLNRCNSPLVFCHNDLQEGNILLHNKYEFDPEGNLEIQGNEEPLVLIDFEYANYNYRGFDFANHICEHILDYSNNKPPYYSIVQQQFPTENEQRLLFNAYLDEINSMAKNASQCRGLPCFVNELPSCRQEAVQQLLTEARRFIAVSHLFWSIWSFKQAMECPIEFDYVSYGLDRIALYYKHKSDLLEYLKPVSSL